MLPVAPTLKVTDPPVQADCATGCVVMLGGVFTVTLKQLGALAQVPLLDDTHTVPELAPAVAVMLVVVDVPVQPLGNDHT